MGNESTLRLRLLTYNVDAGARDRLDGIHQVLDAVDADVVALTEANDPDVVATLAARLGMSYAWERGSGDRHIATLSRFPILQTRVYRTPPLTQVALETRLGSPAGPLTVYGVHFLPYLLLPYEIRRWQAVGKLLGLIRDQGPVPPHVIVGDLNAVGPGDRVLHRRNPARMRRVMALQLWIVFRLAIPRLLRAGYVDCFRALHPDDPGFTFMPGNPTTRYDYIMASPPLAAVLRACRVVDELPGLGAVSDHFPLVAEFEMDGTWSRS